MNHQALYITLKKKALGCLRRKISSISKKSVPLVVTSGKSDNFISSDFIKNNTNLKVDVQTINKIVRKQSHFCSVCDMLEVKKTRC
jgi:hypothetical protein